MSSTRSARVCRSPVARSSKGFFLSNSELGIRNHFRNHEFLLFKNDESLPQLLLLRLQAVKFVLNPEAAKSRQLQVDPRLLKLAKRTTSDAAK